MKTTAYPYPFDNTECPVECLNLSRWSGMGARHRAAPAVWHQKLWTRCDMRCTAMPQVARPAGASRSRTSRQGTATTEKLVVRTAALHLPDDQRRFARLKWYTHACWQVPRSAHSTHKAPPCTVQKQLHSGTSCRILPHCLHLHMQHSAATPAARNTACMAAQCAALSQYCS